MNTAQLECVVMGGSAGSIEVLNTVLPALPKTFALPVAVVIHQPAGHRGLLSELFAPKCRIPVTEVEHGRPLGPGVFFGPPDYHLSVEPDRTFSLSIDPAVCFSRPSIDVLFESAAWTFKQGVLAILLSGANEDGAQGLAAIRKSGGRTWVQAPGTALVPTMPEAGLRNGAAQEIFPPTQMAAQLCSLVPEAT